MQGSVIKRPRWEWPLVIGLLLIAFFFRVWLLNDVPPGLHHDEVIIGQVAQDILRGQWAIYFTPGYGHEPLYHYGVAGMFSAIGANAFVLRLTSAFIAMLGLAVAYRFIRLIFSPVVAIGTLVWMSISLWPVFFARVGLRGITLPLLTTLTAYFLWRALFRKDRETAEQEDRAKSRITHHASRFILPGILLGLSIYTYQASRVFPIIFGLFLLFVFAKQWQAARRAPHSSVRSLPVGRCTFYALRLMLVFFLSALIVAAPLIYYLTVVNPSAESRVADLSEPLNKLLAGDPGEVISSTLATLGMFTFRGDAVPIYNLSGRPVFPEVVGGVLFIVGLLICLWRWKRPAYALMLIWFFISLVPAMVTPFSPNFVRTIASWPVPFVFMGLAMSEIVQWMRRMQETRSRTQDARPKTPRHPVILSPRHLVIALLTLVLLWNAVLTFNDYFIQWPTGDYVRFWQQATWTQAVRALNADPSTSPIAASGLSIQDFEPGADFDPQTFDLLGLRPDVKVKWFDCRGAILYPGEMEQPVIRYLSPTFLKCDDDLKASYLPGLRAVEQPHWPNSGETIFVLEQFDRPWTLSQLLLPRVMTSTLFLGAENFDPISPTRDLVQHSGLGVPEFEGLQLYGNAPYPRVLPSGATLTFDTLWELARPIRPPLKIFVHLSASDGKIVAQWDGLDVNVGTLDPGDLFVQRHRINLSVDLPPGSYRLSIGVYHAETGTRLQANFAGRVIDSIVLGMLSVEK